MCGLVQIGTLTVSDDMSTMIEYSFDQSEKVNYVDGTYTGVGTGFRGDTEVQVIVENGYITDITILSYEDDTEFFQKAQSSILNQILSEQTIDVQNVSGATFSSNGILEAVANALNINFDNPNQYNINKDDRGGKGSHGKGGSGKYLH